MPLRYARRPLALPLLAALLIGVPVRAPAPGRLDVNDVGATAFANGALPLYPDTLL